MPALLAALRKIPIQLRIAGVVLVAALASSLYSSALRPASSVPADAPRTPGGETQPVEISDPEAGAALSRPVEEAFEAARKGEVENYLAQFGSPLREELGKLRAEKGEPYLRDYLTRLAGDVKGVAVRLSEQQEVGPQTVRCPVELVYQDRNEVQSFTLRREGDRWLIQRIESVRAAPTLIPYGTPIQDVK